MGRTLGAKNKTPRELEALAAHLIEKAKLMRENAALKEALKSAVGKKAK